MSNEAPDMAREYEQRCFGCGEKVWWVKHFDTGVNTLRNADGTEHACATSGARLRDEPAVHA